jgi:prepilin-type N-terminal cleavage/methylation domain-containing protein
MNFMQRLFLMKYLIAPRNEKGFTLLELIIVILVAGVLAAISAPSLLTWYQRMRVNNAMSQVQGSLQTAQREAIRRNTNCVVNIDSGNDKMTGDCFLQPDIPTDWVDLKSNETTMNYSYRGTVTLASSGTIVLFEKGTSSPSIKKCLVLSSPLGIVRTGEYTGDVAGSITADDCEGS